MPEMPEVETIAQDLKRRIVGQTVADVIVQWPRSVAWLSSESFSQQVIGRRLEDVTRRGKFIIIRLAPPKLLVVHLGMTGWLLGDKGHDASAFREATANAHTRVLIQFASDRTLRFQDVRKFGRVYLVDDAREIPLLRDLGPEPLSEAFTPAVLGQLLRGHRRQIKPLLLDQRILAGLGNIYVDESLWQARIHPRLLSHRLSIDQVKRLYHAIRQVLAWAIENGGTTLRDYRNPDGEPGHNQWSLSVYGRKGERCGRCGQVVCRITVGGRGTYYCPTCQPFRPTRVLGNASGHLENPGLIDETPQR